MDEAAVMFAPAPSSPGGGAAVLPRRSCCAATVASTSTIMMAVSGSSSSPHTRRCREAHPCRGPCPALCISGSCSASSCGFGARCEQDLLHTTLGILGRGEGLINHTAMEHQS
ncbi:unnamed protein product [Urochloa humidicola]